MRREEIKEMMLQYIRDNYEDRKEELVLDTISEEQVHDFMWDKDFGESLIIDWLNDNAGDAIEEVLEDIYDEIEIEGLDW